MSSHLDKEDIGRRLHKYSPLFILIHIIWKAIVPLFFGIYTSSKLDTASNVILVAGIVIPSFSILQYWFYHYWLKEDKIEIREGILFKQNRKIPYSRIQNVNVSQNLLQRVLKVATLQLESASGGKPEAVMRVVGLGVVEEIKHQVKKVHSAEIVSDPVENNIERDEQDDILHEIKTSEVVKYGIISQKGMVYGALIFGFMAQNQMFLASVVRYMDMFYALPDFTKITLAEGMIYIFVIGLVIFIFLQSMSVLWALMRFYGFKIAKTENRLHASMGLFSKITATIPLKKIQLYRISENPLHKFFKARTITIETAGGVNTDKNGIVMRWLAPYIGRGYVQDFMGKIEPKIILGSVDWKFLPVRSWKRVFKKSLYLLISVSLLLLIISFIPYITIRSYAWIAIFIWLPLGYVYAKNYIRKTAYFYNEDIICFKSGVWFGKQSFVKINKIQTVTLFESPFDRVHKMATVEIDTAGSNLLLHHVKIPYLEREDAYEIRDFLLQRIKNREFDW